MAKVYTKVIINMNTLKVTETDSYDYFGEWEYLGGSSAGEENVAAGQSALFNTMSQQAVKSLVLHQMYLIN